MRMDGCSKLAVWWLRLGIQIERIQPGHPQQNGRHERMHLTLKKEATKPAAANVLQQQARFDAFVERYNRDRPHQALGMKVLADLYVRSARVYRGLEDLTYWFHDQTIMVTHCGRICFKGPKDFWSRRMDSNHRPADYEAWADEAAEHAERRPGCPGPCPRIVELPRRFLPPARPGCSLRADRCLDAAYFTTAGAGLANLAGSIATFGWISFSSMLDLPSVHVITILYGSFTPATSR